jgi:hypothetical protein
MEPAKTSGNSVWRVAIVVVVALIVGAVSLTDVIVPWHPFADFGMRFDAAANIIGVDSDSDAARAGVRPGDAIDLAATPMESRRYLVTGFGAAVDGTHADFAIVRGTAVRHVVLVARLRARSLADNVTDLLEMASDLAILVICSLLVLMRPSKMTWAFFWYGCGVVGEGVSSQAVTPLPLYLVNAFTLAVLDLLAWLPLVFFALRFPNDAATGWRASAQRWLLWSLIVVVPIAMYSTAGLMFGMPQFPWVADVLGLTNVAGFMFAALTFGITYVHASPSDRARLRWVILGLTIGGLGITVFNVVLNVPGFAVALPIWAVNLLEAAQIMVPITVAYAIIRHRVFDVRFVVGRAVVYALLTSTLVVFVALLDFLVGRILSQSHLATIVEVIASIAIGLSLNGLHKRLEGIVDSTLFRSRRRAELRLRRIARGLVHAGSERAITHVLVSEPHAAYGLASSALFARSDDDFVRVESIGWEHARLQTLDASASIVLQLQAEQKPVAAHDATWEAGDLPHGLASPAFALPIFMRGRLEAIAFYGPHLSGEDLDPEELDVLDDLMRAGGAAYDHAAAEIARERLQLLEAEVLSLRGLVAVAADG